MRDLSDEELEETLDFVRVAPRLRRQRRGVDVARLDGAHVELEAVAVALAAAEYADGVAFPEPPVEELHVVPDASLDPAGRVHELECEVRRASPGPQPALRLDGEHALDDAILGEVGDHAPSLVRASAPALALTV